MALLGKQQQKHLNSFQNEAAKGGLDKQISDSGKQQTSNNICPFGFELFSQSERNEHVEFFTVLTQNIDSRTWNLYDAFVRQFKLIIVRDT